MKEFYVITNKSKQGVAETAARLQSYIEMRGGTCILAEDGTSIPATAECVLVIGGDGTLIRTARELRFHDIPLLGINMGTLGYLTDVEVQHMEAAVEQVMAGESWVEERMMLHGTLNGQEEAVAWNDIVVTRLGAVRMIRFQIYVNGELLNSYKADGVIVSTPTGSTAYNLSAGGPIVEPTASLIVITPICSHALNTSSIVLSAEDEIVIEIGEGRDGEREGAEISFDGDHHMEAYTGDRLLIQKASETTRLLKLSKVSFLETLRTKMKGN
ncbi:MAG: NAD(+)/NADH kinase [Faecalimonas sp.]|nr:NAD(+)/NADH kinase [Faecalimonas sp.]